MNIVGNISLDTAVYNFAEETRRLQFWGGSGLNIAMSVVRAGFRPRLLSVCGTDFEKLLVNLSKYIAVDHIAVKAGSSCSFELNYDPSGKLLDISSNYGVSSTINQHLAEIDPFPEDHTHICYRTPLEAEIVQRLATENRSLSIDFISSSMYYKIDEIIQFLPKIQWIFVNGDEFETLRNKFSIRHLQNIINTSANNCVKYYYKGILIHELTFEEKSFLDVTGSGDTFIGSFLAGVLQETIVLQNLQQAIVAAQHSLKSPGVWSQNELTYVIHRS